MKTVYSTLLFLCLAFMGCKENDKEEVTPALESKLTGTWVTSLIRLHYYDASNALDHEDLIYDENGGTVIFDGKGNATQTYPLDTPDTGKYEFKTRNGLNFLIFTDGSRSAEYEIITLSDTKLIYKAPYHRLTYTKNGASKTASKSVYIEEYDKQ